ncbi:MAG: SH3 domain-containing protein [Myxococcaceae bacterium]
MRRYLRSWMVVVMLSSGAAAAQPRTTVDSLLQEIDAELKARGGRRVAVPDSVLCSKSFNQDPPLENRQFLCSGTQPVGSWDLTSLRADGGAKVSARFDVRRFTSKEAAERVRKTAITLFRGEHAIGHDQWSISWCYHDVLWTNELLISLQYGCDISLPHVKALQAISGTILSHGVPFGDLGAVGIRGRHSGWSFLIDAEGQHIRSPERKLEVEFARVVGVEPNDSLRVRDGPDSSTHEMTGISPGATCIPVIWASPDLGWWRVKAGEFEGWANARFLRRQNPGECQSADAGTADPHPPGSR